MQMQMQRAERRERMGRKNGRTPCIRWPRSGERPATPSSPVAFWVCWTLIVLDYDAFRPRFFFLCCCSRAAKPASLGKRTGHAGLGRARTTACRAAISRRLEPPPPIL